MSTEIIDQAIFIRKGEELDLGPLEAYLNDKLPEPGGQARNPAIPQRVFEFDLSAPFR